jgi:hypothetical protein
MAAAKPEVLVSQLVYVIETKFQQVLGCSTTYFIMVKVTRTCTSADGRSCGSAKSWGKWTYQILEAQRTSTP